MPDVSPLSMTTMALVALLSLPLGAGAGAAVGVLSGRICRWHIAGLASLLPGLATWAAAVVPSEWLMPSLLLAWCLLVLAVVDLLAFRLPDAITLPLMGAGIVLATQGEMDAVLSHMLGAALGYGGFVALAWGYWKLRGREGLGRGDAKLMAAAGAWLGPQALPSVVVLGCGVAMAFALTQGKTTREAPLAFGAPLCLGFWIVWLYGPLPSLL